MTAAHITRRVARLDELDRVAAKYGWEASPRKNITPTIVSWHATRWENKGALFQRLHSVHVMIGPKGGTKDYSSHLGLPDDSQLRVTYMGALIALEVYGAQPIIVVQD